MFVSLNCLSLISRLPTSFSLLVITRFLSVLVNLFLFCYIHCFIFVVVVQSLSHVQLFVTPWIAACQASLFFTISRSLFKLMSIESVMSSNHLILCSLLLLPSVSPSIRVFSNESALCVSIGASVSALPMNI